MELYVTIGAFVIVITTSVLVVFMLKSIRDHIAGGLWQLNDAIGKVANVDIPTDISIRLDNAEAATNELRALVERRYKSMSQIENRRKRREQAGDSEEFDEDLETAVESAPPQLQLEEPEGAPAQTNSAGRHKRPRLRRIE